MLLNFCHITSVFLLVYMNDQTINFLFLSFSYFPFQMNFMDPRNRNQKFRIRLLRNSVRAQLYGQEVRGDVKKVVVLGGFYYHKKVVV